MDKSFKEKILTLREKGLSYDDIKYKLGCSKATISYHCKRYGLNYIEGFPDTRKIKDKKIEKIINYYKTHTIDETAKKFNISKTTVKRYSKKIIIKKILLSEEERVKRNYVRVKTRRQKLKEIAVKYKGGKCERCGYDKCIWAFDFHHKKPNKKDFSISTYYYLAWDKIKKELDKCIMICSNCHREIHFDLEQKKNIAE